MASKSGYTPKMVLVRDIGYGWASCIGEDGAIWHVPSGKLHPMPAAMTEQERAVVEAAKEYAAMRDRHGDRSSEAEIARGRMLIVVEAFRVSRKPADPVAEVKAARQAQREAWRLSLNGGQHEDYIGACDRLDDAIAALEKEKKS